MNHPTRIYLSLLLAGGMTATLPAQETPPPPPPEDTERTPDDLDNLLGPVALYPDDLLAIMLPAAARPTDIVLAARYLENKGAMDKIDEQHWDESVRALAHFPDVVEWMNKNLAWTQDLGDAFAAQPAEVMKSIQRLRAKAYAAGTLRDTEQHKILVDGNVIRIVSAKEDVVYAPHYRPEVVYVDRPVYYSEPWITFGIGWTIGAWYHWGCDWYGYNIWVYDHHDHWHDYHHNYYYGDPHHYGYDYYHGYHYNYGHAWYPPQSHAHYNYHGDGHNDHHDGYGNHPGPYGGNGSVHRNWNHDGGSHSGNPTGHTNDHNDQNNSNNPNVPERRAVDPGNNRGSHDGNRNPGVIVNNDGAPNNSTPPGSPDSLNRNDRNRGIGGDTGGVDRSRSPRSGSPANRTGSSVAAMPDSPPPVVTSSQSRSNGRSLAENSVRPDYTQRSRQETRTESGTNRTVRAYAAERTHAPVSSESSYGSRSDSSRSSAAYSSRYNGTSTNYSATTTTSSSGRYHGGDSGSSRSSSSSESSGSRGSNSSRSSNSGGGDHSNGHSGGGGRGR